MVRLRRGIATRTGWGLGDQALSSLTNVALGIVVARSVSPTEFGAYSLAFATYLLIIGVVRALSSQPLVIRYTTVDQQTWADGVRRSTAVAVGVGILAGIGSLIVAMVATHGTLQQAFLALAFTMPGLMLQDCWRFAFLARGNGRAAFMNDLAWAVIMIPPFVVLLATSNVTVLTAVFAWGAAGTVAAVYGCFQARLRPAPRGIRSWFREHRDVLPSYLGEYGATAASVQLGLITIAAVANLAVVGALRAAEIVLGPLRSLFQGVRQVAQPEAVRTVAARRNLLRGGVLLSAAMVVVAFAVGGLLIALPDSVGRAILGEAWDPAQEILWPMTIGVAASGALIGAQMGLHAVVAVRRTLVSRIWLTIMLTGARVAGAVVGGALGAATFGAVAYWIGAALWWWQFLVAYRDHLARRDDEPDDSVVDPAVDDIAMFGQ